MSGLTADLVVSRSVRDAAAALDAVQGPAPGDPYAAPPPARPYVEELNADPGTLRIGMSTTSEADADPEPAVVAAVEDAARLLTDLGHDVAEDRPTGFDAFDPVGTFYTRWMAGQGATLKALGRVLRRELGPDDVEPLTWALAEEGRRRSAADYLDAIATHHTITRMIAAWFESGFDLLLTPTRGDVPPPLGTFDDSGPDPLEAFERAQQTAMFTALFNATGQPAISLPLHWNEDGLPIGSQLVAPSGGEDLLIRVAAQLEQARPWADRRPPVFAGAEARSGAR
jgi:amidase